MKSSAKVLITIKMDTDNSSIVVYSSKVVSLSGRIKSATCMILSWLSRLIAFPLNLSLIHILLIIILIVGVYTAYTGLLKRETSKALHAVINIVVVIIVSASFIAYAPNYIQKINDFSSDISTASLDLGTKIMLPDSQSKGKDSVDLIRDSLFAIQVEKPWLLLQFGNSDTCLLYTSLWK